MPASLGLYTTLVTSGLGLTRKRAEALRAAGLEHMQVSVQDADAATAERIAGVSSVKQKQAAIALVEGAGLRLLRSTSCSTAPTSIASARSSISPAEPGAPTGWSSPTRSTTAGGSRTARRSCPPGIRWSARRTIAQDRDAALQGADADHSSCCPTTSRSCPRPATAAGARYYIVVAPDGKALPCHGAYADPHARPAQRAGPLARLDLAASRPAFQAFRGDALDEGALPELPAEGGGLRRLPLPGVRAHRRRRQRRSGLHR